VSTLGFLEIGVAPPTPEGGLDLNLARRFISVGEWWLAVVLGIMIFLKALSFNLVGEAIMEAASQ
jgi:peptide/nickel transport system permease protein